MASLMHQFGVGEKPHLKRSRWMTPVRQITTFKQGVLIPLGFYDVIPDSHIEDDVNQLTRLLLTPAKPFIGDMYLTYGAYFVPYRILFKNYVDIFGNGKPSEWSLPSEWVFPTAPAVMSRDTAPTFPSGSGVGYDACDGVGPARTVGGEIFCQPGNLADYLGLPLSNVDTVSGTVQARNEYVNIAPFLAYERIWSDYWRDENYQNEDPDLQIGFNLASGSTSLGTMEFNLHYANKFHDYFTSILPDTQKGEAMGVLAPLNTIGSTLNIFDSSAIFGNGSGQVVSTAVPLGLTSTGVLSRGVAGSFSQTGVVGSSNLGVNIGVKDLRMAFALQRAKERNARTGSRSLNEAMLGIYGAETPAVLNKAEYLGGNTIHLNLLSVPQTGSDAGKLGAFSATGSKTTSFKKYISEPGLIMYVGVVRCKHQYVQGLDRYWTKKRRYDFYDPALAHISEQPIKIKEIVANAGNILAPNDQTFGFLPAWSEYEKPVEKITGLFRSSFNDARAWVLQDDINYRNVFLSVKDFMTESGSEVARICTDFNSSYPAFVFGIDFKANLLITAPKPLKCIPGFIDHII